MNNQVFNKDYIYLDADLPNQDSVFNFIAEKAFELGLITSKESLVKGFKAREDEGSTGFEDGFAIPHSRIKEVKQAAVFVIRLKEAIDWNSMDGKPTNVMIALLVPEGPTGDEHLSILSEVAVKLMDDDFKKTLNETNDINVVLQALNASKADKDEAATIEQPVAAKTKNIIAITACAVGIAHTFMAEDKLLKTGKELGYNIRVETHGSKGIGTPFTDEEVEAADLVILATDVNVDRERFVGKKIYHVPVAKAIKAPVEVINNAWEQGVVMDGKGFDTSKGKKAKQQEAGLIQHILAGISYMIPVIVLGGICLAFSLGLAKAIWGPTAGTKGIETVTIIDGVKHVSYSSPWGPLAILEMIGGAAFTLMIPILAGFIANSIAGRAAIAPAMVGAFIGNNAGNFMPIGGMGAVQTPTGFIGALIAGIAVGYFVKWVNTWKVPRSIAPAMPIFVIPLVAGIGISVIFIYVIGGPIGFVMDKISSAINTAYSGQVGIWVGLGLGALIGAMAGFDMGGPINKIAFVTCSALVTNHIYQPMGSMAAAIPVAPIAMGISTQLCKKFFTKDEQSMGVAAIIMGCIGISEGAIPFAVRDSRRAIPSNVLGSLIAGAIAGAFGVTNMAAHGGPIVAILGAVPYGLETLYFFIAIIAGVAVTTATYVLWMKHDARKGKGVGTKNLIENAIEEVEVKADKKALGFKKLAFLSKKNKANDEANQVKSRA